jgi:S-formylglutathione hydrolase FrmB
MEINLPSRARGRETNYLVYIPGPDVPRPTIFLLHGAQESHLIWKERFGRELLDLAQELNVNLVMPDGDHFGWYLDSPFKKNSRLEQYLMRELFADLRSRFQLDESRIGVLGISMGGHGALTLALKNPNRFKAISSISGFTDLGIHSDSDPINEDLQLTGVLGPYSTQSQIWRQNSAYYLTRMHPQALKDTSIVLTVGISDPVTLGENRQYHRLLEDLGLTHDYFEERGGFSWELWQEKVPEQLTLLAERLKL